MPVNTPSAYYESLLPKWARCRDAADGEDAIKAKKTTYLPVISEEQTTAQYDSYLSRAAWYPATGRTIEGLVGSVFQKPITVNVPPAITDHTRDITQAGECLEQFARLTMVENMITGRYGILVDMAKAGGIPYWLRYRAEDILSVRRERIEGVEVLTRVVLQERADVPDEKDEFVTKQVDQIRVLELVNGAYQVRLWRKEEGREKYEPWQTDGQESLEAIPLRRGEALPFIPFVLPDDKKPPLQDLASLNIHHFMGSANHENILYWVGHPHLWGRSVQTDDDGKIRVGPGRLIMTGENGHLGVVQASAEGCGAIVASMESKEKKMAMLGARLLEEQPRTDETATAVRMRHGGEHATLRTEAGSLEADLSRALQMHAWWFGTDANLADVEATVELNKDFLPEPMDSQMLQQVVMAWQSGLYSWKTAFYLAQRGELARPGISAEQEEADIRAEGGGIPQPFDLGDAAA